MLKFSRCFLFSCIFVLPIFCAVAQNGETVEIGERFQIKSLILEEERTIYFRLPYSYDSSESSTSRFPVVYLLDGESTFHLSSGIIDLYAYAVAQDKQIPEAIVVAIENTDRERDLLPTHSLKDYFNNDDQDFKTSGHASSFLSFIESELIPYIESRYEVSESRTIIGESFGGLFVLNAVKEKPQVFDNYIAIDPSLWWDDQQTAKQFQKRFKQNCDEKIKLFIATAAIPDGLPPAPMQDGRAIIESTLKRCVDGFSHKVKHFSEEDHGSVSIPALITGLRFVFDTQVTN